MAIIRNPWLIGLLLGTSAALITSCNYDEKDSIPVQDKTGKTPGTKNKAMISVFGDAVPLDSSTIVMYPLNLDASRKDEADLKRYSSESGNGSYWNIAFYDTKTENANLLVSDRVIRINSFQKLKDIIVYNVTAEDYNGDGKLDHKDPNYLFTSELTGKSFKQITPNHMDVRSFRAIEHSATILIQTVADSNKDKTFEDNDTIAPMVFNARKMDVAKETFSATFKAELDKTFNKLY